MSIDSPENICVAQSKIPGAGRGVFAIEPIAAGELIEACPVIYLPGEGDRLVEADSYLHNYWFLWPEMPDIAIALGYGSLYNHSFNPNAVYEKDFDRQEVVYTALADIAAREEITVNYNFGNPADKSPLWFDLGSPPAA